MKGNAVKPALCDREKMTDEERELFLSDLKNLCEEYFEGGSKFTTDMTRTANGFSVCVIFDAARIKSFKKPR